MRTKANQGVHNKVLLHQWVAVYQVIVLLMFKDVPIQENKNKARPSILKTTLSFNLCDNAVTVLFPPPQGPETDFLLK